MGRIRRLEAPGVPKGSGRKAFEAAGPAGEGYNAASGRGRSPELGAGWYSLPPAAEEDDPMRTLVAVALAAGLGGLGLADDKKADPSGTWTWETERNGQKRETTLKLKVAGEKVTGTITAGGGKGKAQEAKIEDGTYKGGEVSFTVTREVKDQKFTSKYKAKVDGDVLKGTVETDFGGKEQKREFEAKRAKVKD